MIHGLTFKEYIEDEKNKLSEMNKAEKKDYFKEYYLKTVIFAVIVLILLIWILIDVGINMRHSIVTGGVVNLDISEEGSLYLGNDYRDYLGKSKLTNKVNIAPGIFLDRNEPESYTIFQAELATNSYNYLITDDVGLEFVNGIECLADLDEVLDSDLSGKLADKKIYKKSGESDKEIAAAIDITDTAFTKDYIKTGEKVYFVVSGKPEEYESAIGILKYILEKK